MNRIASDLIKIASELLPRITAVFDKGPKVEDKALNSVHFDIQHFVVTVQKNEEKECIVWRRDDSKVMEITIGFTDHEQMEGIVESLKAKIEKLARKANLNVKVSILNVKN
jgi:hypothetical protein